MGSAPGWGEGELLRRRKTWERRPVPGGSRGGSVQVVMDEDEPDWRREGIGRGTSCVRASECKWSGPSFARPGRVIDRTTTKTCHFSFPSFRKITTRLPSRVPS